MTMPVVEVTDRDAITISKSMRANNEITAGQKLACIDWVALFVDLVIAHF